MSELPPADRPQRPATRRSARSRGKYSAARRLKGEQSLTTDLAQKNEETSLDQEEAITSTASVSEERRVSQPLIAPIYGAGDAATPQRRWLTPMSKQILLWGSITAGVFGLLDIALYFFGLAFANTQAQAQQNAGIVTPVFCLSYLIPYALPFIAGWRATLREGLGRHGGLAGLVSGVLSLLVGKLIETIINATQGQLHGPRNGDIQDFVVGLLIQAVISFAFGWFGGSYSSWQRRRAQRKQEQSAEAVSPS
jgi:hypothetical protein